MNTQNEEINLTKKCQSLQIFIVELLTEANSITNAISGSNSTHLLKSNRKNLYKRFQKQLDLIKNEKNSTLNKINELELLKSEILNSYLFSKRTMKF